jgi:hypothetical protein
LVNGKNRSLSNGNLLADKFQIGSSMLPTVTGGKLVLDQFDQ